MNQVFDSIAISRDGQQVGWITNVDRSTLYTVTIWDRTATTGSLVQYRGDHGAGMWLDRLVFEGIEPLGIYVDNTHIEVRQLRDGVIRYQIATSDSLDTISQDETLMTYWTGGQVSIRQVQDGHLVWRFPTRHYAPLSLDTIGWIAHTAFSPDTQFLVIAASVNRESGGLAVGIPSFSRATREPAVLWHLRTGQVVQRFDVQPDGARFLAYSPDGQYVAAARDNEVRVFRVQPQPPFLQPGCVLAGFFLALLLFWQWLWARR